MILALKTSEPTAELTLLQADGTVIAHETWLADRRLARELLAKLEHFLQDNGFDWTMLQGLIVYQGPGSFTGLRIGITVMNTIAYAQDVAIVGTSKDSWLREGCALLRSGHDDKAVLPEYGAPPRITAPKK